MNKLDFCYITFLLLLLSCNNNKNNETGTENSDPYKNSIAMIDINKTQNDEFLNYKLLFAPRMLPLNIDSIFLKDSLMFFASKKSPLDSIIITNILFKDTTYFGSNAKYSDTETCQYYPIYMINFDDYSLYMVYERSAAGGWDDHILCFNFDAKNNYISSIGIGVSQADGGFEFQRTSMISTDFSITLYDKDIKYNIDTDEIETLIYDTLAYKIDSFGDFIEIQE